MTAHTPRQPEAAQNLYGDHGAGEQAAKRPRKSQIGLTALTAAMTLGILIFMAMSICQCISKNH